MAPQIGESLTIKVAQLDPKNPYSGIGFLENGAWVIINGGSQHIGKTVTVIVHQIYPTATGKDLILAQLKDDE